MTLDSGDQAAVIGVGVAVILAVGTALFKAATLRGDMNNRWSRRVAFAVAALDEKAISELRLLRGEVEQILPEESFTPADAIADPAPLSRRAEKTGQFYRARTRMERDLGVLMRLGPVFVGALAAMVPASAGLTAHYGELLSWPWLRMSCLGVLSLSVAVLIAATLVYVVLQHRLAGAEILADTGGRMDRDDS